MLWADLVVWLLVGTLIKSKFSTFGVWTLVLGLLFFSLPQKICFQGVTYLRGEGGLNLSLGLPKVWGDNARSDSLADYFGNKFAEANLTNLAPTPLKPTWKNNRTGTARVAKRIDRFLINDSYEQFFDHQAVDWLWRTVGSSSYLSGAQM